MTDPALDMPAHSDIRAALDRIAASAAFRSAPQLTAFLRYVVGRTLAGESARIKAYTIAVEALGRRANFDPQGDPIVRVEAVRLRAALARYYAGEGRDEPVVIALARGCYVPAFAARADAAAVCAAPALAAEPLASALPQLIALCRAIGGADGPLGADGDADALALIDRLDAMVGALVAATDLCAAVEAILAAALALHDVERGNVKLRDWRSGELTILAHRGFKAPFLRAFGRVLPEDNCASAIATRERRAVVVADVMCAPLSTAYRAVAEEAGLRAVQATPLITSGGDVVGVLTTFVSRPHAPSKLVMATTRLYARLAADLVARLAPECMPALPLDHGRLSTLSPTPTADAGAVVIDLARHPRASTAFACRSAPPLLPTAPSFSDRPARTADGRQEQRQQAQSPRTARTR